MLAETNSVIHLRHLVLILVFLASANVLAAGPATIDIDLSWTSRESMRQATFDIKDRHYDNAPRWFTARYRKYNGRDHTLPPLYLGEVAVTSGKAR